MKTIFFLLLLSAALSAAPSANLPLDHWAYGFLERLEAKGLISGYELRVRPIPRSVAAELTARVLQNAESLQRLSRTDRRLLEQLRSDLQEEEALRSLGSAAREPHLHSSYEEDAVLHLDLIARQEILSRRGGEYVPEQLQSLTTAGARLRGTVGSSWALFAEARNTLSRGEERAENDENFDPAKGEPVVVSGGNVYRDRSIAYAVWQKSRLRFEAGKDEVDWGPFFGQGFALSLNAPPADLLRLSYRLQNLKFTWQHAWLRSPLGAKYLAAHRIDLKLMRGLYVGGAETVVYAGRSPEPSYLNPFMLYHIAEHHLGDRDNNNLAVDAVFTRIPNLTLAAEWYIDDMTSTKSWRHYFGNKFAWAVGGLWSDAFFLRDLDLRFRYGRISPYVYTHWDSINIYTHYDKILGNAAGPNADEFELKALRRFSRDFYTEVYGRWSRKGQGAADTHTRPASGDRKDFMTGIVEKRSTIGFRISDQVRRDLFVIIDYAYEDVRNGGLVAGQAFYNHLVRVIIDLNY